MAVSQFIYAYPYAPFVWHNEVEKSAKIFHLSLVKKKEENENGERKKCVRDACASDNLL